MRNYYCHEDTKTRKPFTRTYVRFGALRALRGHAFGVYMSKELTYLEAIREGARRGDAPRSEGLRARRGRRSVRRRLRRDAGAARGVRRDARGRHADLGVGHHRREHRRVAARIPAGCRNAVRRLHLVRLRSDRQPGGDAALPLRRPGDGADCRARAERRQRRRRPVPFAESRSVVHPSARVEGRRAVDGVRRQGAVEGGHPRRQPGGLLRAQVSVPPRQGTGSRRRRHRADRRRRHAPRGHATRRC